MAVPVLAQPSQKPTVSVFMFEARVRSFAPAIEAIISLSEDQKKQLAQAYDEAFGGPAARLAGSVLQDMNASVAQRQMASTTMLQAQASFRAKSRTIFTDQQRDLVDRVYAAFNRVYAQAQDEMVKLITGGFAKELDTLLTPEQKQAMAKRQAELDAAKPKPATTEQPGAKPGDGQPGKAN
jgi:hypothetical protein